MLKGTLEGCVMRIVDVEQTYGYAIVRRLNELGFADVTEGTVYTILLRLERRGLVDVAKRPSELGPPRKFYPRNDKGRGELARFWARWDYLSSRIEILKEKGGAGTAGSRRAETRIGRSVREFWRPNHFAMPTAVKPSRARAG